ncbi:uncharacterized protein DUF748 [Roseivirga ehrenbergii]|uniref:AsmA-like C-terminal domain-containing protein n=1 Tax=Roseivirga ehrenbergii (strain DSM 102268 / JCM 13514 / KCTC 12282 / NCIMB 14502 / KMM 6017) TaxID=279360 RepID=A0A150XP32_ROSEK|nr:DUF748 domain-containing protein [Roseivirga ehrenbergii]KYG80500.1 hypothetical protein MB14_15210 [Roseivirga ehrenbergii]TCL07741.1 uncharacterized protein DUF748 [Roseivirga ehrenbergii]
MEKPSKTWLRIFKITGITVLTVVFLLSIFVSFFLKGIINNRLKKEINDTFGDFYTLSFENSYTSLSWNGFNIEFEKVEFETDTANKFMMMRYPAVFFKTNSFKIDNINISNLFFDSVIDLKKVAIDKPELLFFIPEKESLTENNSENSEESAIKNIQVANFELSDGSASFVFNRNLADTLYAGKNVNVKMEDLKIDLNSTENIVKTSKVEQVAFSLDEILLSPKDSDYDYRIEGINFNYRDELLQCFGVEITAKRDPYKMTLESQFRKTIFNISLDTLNYQSGNFKELKDLSSIKGSALHLVNLNLDLVRNKSIPLDETQYKELFHKSLLNLSIPVEIDSVYLKNGSIDYKIHSDKELEPGNLMLTQLNATIVNLYTEKNKRDVVTASFKGVFMEDAPFTFQAKLPLNDPNNHTYNGHIGAMKLTSLNPLIANLTRVKLAEGRINRLDFEGRGNQLKNWGTMRSDFEGLKLKVTDSQNNERWLQSGLGNLIARKNNRGSNDNLTDSVEYVFERPPYKDHLTLYAGGLIEGFALSILPKSVYNLIMSQ